MQAAASVDVALPGITALALADIIVILSLAKSSNSITSVKSIRWVAAHLQVIACATLSGTP